MNEWFDTNYHYLVPELDQEQPFMLASPKPFEEFAEALALGIRTVPVLVGPLTFLLLAKTRGRNFDRLSLLPKLLPVYAEVLRRLRAQGAEWVQLDEPALGLDLTAEQRVAFGVAHKQLREAAGLAIIQIDEPAAKVIPKERLWVNPDCGLKTRRWEEVKPALRNLVAAARQARAAA